MLFFVKVRVNIDKMAEFGRRLQTGALNTHPLSTYCLKEDPSVGLNIWEAEDEKGFESAFAPHREFYTEILEISPVILPQESMKILMNQAAE
ncbi:MAG TPA: hypothetical protein VF338_02700 [Leptolinea sp.]